MPPRLRPIEHDARLTIVDHLDELRWRLIVCLVGVAVATGACFWQSERLLDLLNGPLERASAPAAAAPPAQQAPPASGGGGAGAGTGGTAGAGAGGAAGTDRAAEREALRQLSGAVEQLADAAGLDPRQHAAIARRLAAARRSLDAPAAAAPRPGGADAPAAGGGGAAPGAEGQAPTAAGGEPAGGGRHPVTLGIAEPFGVSFMVSLHLGLVISLPLLLYHLYAFVVPAFSRAERRIALPLMTLAPLLFAAGGAFGFLVVVPAAVGFLQQFNAASFDILVQARDYYAFVALVTAVMGLVFELPLLVVGINRAGLVTARGLRGAWRWAIVIAAVLAALGPGTDPLTMLLMMVPLVLLYGISVAIVTVLERRDRRTARAGR